MRKILLISLAAVIVAGSLAITAYGAEGEGREGPPRGRPGGEGQRRGPPRPELNDDQRGALENDPAVKEARAELEAAVAKFQKAIKNIIKDERTARMVMFQAIMRTMPRPEGDRTRGDRDSREKKPEHRAGQRPDE